ncbi:MAG TPA: PQQ-binding-like beta-propeller repeat protein [Thermomicrobiales bacterium]
MRLGSRNAERERQIQRYWDALVTGAPPDDLARLAAPLDPTLVTLIARVRASHQRRPPDPAFVTELERRVMDTFTRTQTVPIPLHPGLRGPRGTGTQRRPFRRLFGVPETRRSWAFAQFATALLLVVTLIAIYVAFFGSNQQGAPPIGGTATPVAPTTTAIAGTPTADWSTMRGGADRASFVEQPGPTTEFGPRWTFRAPSLLHFPVRVSHTVYVNSAEGVLYALDAASGQQRWAFDSYSASSSSTGAAIYPSVTVADGLVFLPTIDGKLYAVDAGTGQPAWTAITTGSVTSNPAVVDGTVYVTTTSGTVAALDAATGAQRWQTDLGASTTTSTPAVAAGLVFQGDDQGHLTALDAATGATRWVAQIGGNMATPAFSGGTVYVVSGDGRLHAVDAATGTERWQFVASDAGIDVVQSPAVAGQTVVVNVTGRGTIALDAATGTQIWSANTTGSGTPLIGGVVVYVASALDEVFAVDLATGRIMGRVKVQGGGGGSAMLAGRILYVAGTRTLTALVGGPATPIANRATPPATTPPSTGG